MLEHAGALWAMNFPCVQPLKAAFKIKQGGKVEMIPTGALAFLCKGDFVLQWLH